MVDEKKGGRKTVSSKEISGGIKAIIGGILVHLTLGTIYTWGNMSPYVVSYVRNVAGLKQFRHQDFVQVLALAFSGQAIGMTLSGKAERYLGPRITALIGGAILSPAIFVSSFLLESVFWFRISYGLIFGIGMGFAYTAPLSCALRWLPSKKGLISGLITAGLGASALIFNQLQTLYINSENVKMIESSEFPDESYFEDLTLLHKVPSLIRISSILYFVILSLGAMLLVNPASEIEEEKTHVDFSNKKSRLLSVDGFNVVEQKNDPHVKLHTAIFTGRYIFLFITFVLNGLAVTFVGGMWKVSPGAINYNDRSLSAVGSIASVANSLGRILWGLVADSLSLNVAFVCLTGLWTASLIVWPFLGGMNLVVFTIIICSNFACLGGTFALFPAATAAAFGATSLGTIYGTIFLSQLIASNSSAKLTQILWPLIGIKSLCFFYAAITTFSLILFVQYGNKIDHSLLNSKFSKNPNEKTALLINNV